MKVLMLSTDRALLGEKISTGDAIHRHRQYAAGIEKLDIIVFSRPGYQTSRLADNLYCYPTNSRFSLFYFIGAWRIAKRLLADNNYNLIVSQDPFLTGLAGYFIKRKFKSKLLVHFHGDFWHNPYWLKERPVNRLLFLISKFVVKQADALRVVSLGIKRKLCRAGLPAAKIKVIPTPVDLSKFNCLDNQTLASIRREFRDKKIILWVGRLEPEKNLVWLLKQFVKIVKIYPSVVLLLAGSGSQFRQLDILHKKLGLAKNVKFLGHINYQDLVNYYYLADLFVLPSLHESFGKVLVEAGACAKPVVASKTTGASSVVVDKKTGFLVPVNNQKQFIDKVSRLLNNSELAHQLGLAAQKHIQQKFNYQDNTRNIVRYWQEISIGKI